MHAAAGSHAQCFLRVLSKAEKISTTILKRDHFLEIWHFLTIFEILICFEAGNASLSLGCQIFCLVQTLTAKSPRIEVFKM